MTIHDEGVWIMHRRGAVIRAALAAAALAAGSFAVQIATTAPAQAALDGLVLAQPASSQSDGAQTHNATSRCTGGRVVVGGGAKITGSNLSHKRLTLLMPVDTGEESYFAVTAQANTQVYEGNWGVTAYAVCAFRRSDYRIEPRADSAHSAGAFKQTAAVCSGGRRVIGTGASVSAPVGKAGLVLNRSAGPLDISRASAHAEPGFTGAWHVSSWAICMNPIGAQVAGGTGSQAADADCPGSTRVHGAGGGGGLRDDGPVFVRTIEPLTGLRRVHVEMTGPYPVFMVAQAICA
jgi:hypothetical protein